ncbi:SDR family NAD(P)-dependent oxidoreductase [Microbacterium terrisoli]|uniref:SDR family NAD(P)-dependent oxidoreductase n=1 Tax=Microbacterium terrisoli TaxID=3242192 RepID=UPI002803A5C9|nr:SDR family NAD(P)-dependent oxidoreductase [Microbacterium protaetiae]
MMDAEHTARHFDWDVADLTDQHGRTIVVTGASGGIGWEITQALVGAGATVIAAVRDVEKMAARVAQAADRQGYTAADRQGYRVLDGLDAAADRIVVRRVDVSDRRSIDRFIEALAADGVVLDALVNNAGASVPRFELSVDGIELTYATNLVGAARLAEGLLALLVGPAPRIVLVGTNLSQRLRAVPDLERSGDPAAFSQFRAYVRSKIAAAAFAVDLGERLAASGSPVRSVIAHPGVAATGMSAQADRALTRAIASVTTRLGRTAADAARSVIWSATAAEIEQGVFVGPALRRSDRRLHVVPVRGAVADPAFRARVREFLATDLAARP